MCHEFNRCQRTWQALWDDRMILYQRWCSFFQILVFNRKMLEDSMPASAASTAVITTTAQHQQMAREIQNADFAEEYFASLSAPAKRLIEVRKIIIILHTFHFWYSKTNCFLRFIKSLQCLKITSRVSSLRLWAKPFSPFWIFAPKISIRI